MGWDYVFYNPNNGKRIDSGRFCGMEILYDKDFNIPKCAIDLDYKTYTIKQWTIDENDKLYKNYFEESIFNPNYNMTYYITKELAEKMQNKMTINETLFTDLMKENQCDSLIVNIC